MFMSSFTPELTSLSRLHRHAVSTYHGARHALDHARVAMVAIALLSACTRSPQQVADGDDPLAALTSSVVSTRYTDGYWREQARADSAGRWARAVAYCGEVGRPRPGLEADGAKPNCGAVYGAESALATHRAVEAAGKRLDEFDARNRESPQEAAARRQGKAPVPEAWRF